MDKYIDDFDIDIKGKVKQVNINKKSNCIIHFKKNINIHLNSIGDKLIVKLYNVKLSGNINVVNMSTDKSSTDPIIHLSFYNCVILGDVGCNKTKKFIVVNESINCHFSSLKGIKKNNFYNSKIDRRKIKKFFQFIDIEPKSSRSKGKIGQVYTDYKYMYICIEKNTWVRLKFVLSDWSY